MLKILSQVKCRLQFELKNSVLFTKGKCGDHFLALVMKRPICPYYKYIYSTHCLKFKPPDIRFALKSSMHHFAIKIYAYTYSFSFLMNGPRSCLKDWVMLSRFSCRFFFLPFFDIIPAGLNVSFSLKFRNKNIFLIIREYSYICPFKHKISTAFIHSSLNLAWFINGEPVLFLNQRYFFS